MDDPMHGWRCDTCGKLHKPQDARYTIADNEAAKTFRHWACHTPLETALDDLRDSIRRAEQLAKRLR